jgi:Na+/melibiose symporter-like transporter
MKLSIKEKLGYSVGDTASHFVWDLVGFWLLIFYTDIYGLSPAVAGIIMFVGSIWDGIMDPIVGIISDRTNTRWGKFRPYLLFGAIPYAILAVLAFTTPDFGTTGKIAYALITCLLLRTAYAFVNLPYSSLGAVMTNDSYERAESKADFIHKVKIAMKEADETEFWLFLCNELENYPNSDELLNDIFEILKITNKIIATSKNK